MTSHVWAKNESELEWFIGTINNSEPRTSNNSLDFLDKNQEDVIYVYSDDESVQTWAQVGVDVFAVRHTTTLDIPLTSAGGQQGFNGS